MSRNIWLINHNNNLSVLRSVVNVVCSLTLYLLNMFLC